MSVIYIALPIALALGAAGMIACIMCIRSGQYDDMDTPALRILIEDRDTSESPEPVRPIKPAVLESDESDAAIKIVIRSNDDQSTSDK